MTVSTLITLGLSLKTLAAFKGIALGMAGGFKILSASAPAAASASSGLGKALTTLVNPYVIAGIAILTAAVYGLAYAYNLSNENSSKEEEAKANKKK